MTERTRAGASDVAEGWRGRGCEGLANMFGSSARVKECSSASGLLVLAASSVGVRTSGISFVRSTTEGANMPERGIVREVMEEVFDGSDGGRNGRRVVGSFVAVEVGASYVSKGLSGMRAVGGDAVYVSSA